MTDIQQIYRRSLLGMAWIGVSFAMFVGIKILIFGSFVSVESDYFGIWLGVGFWVWLLVLSLVVDGCNVFVNARPWIMGTNLPFSVYAFQIVARSFMRFLFTVPIIIFIMIYYKWMPNWGWLWALPGIVVIMLNGLWVQFFLGTICARFRDVSHLMQSIMQVMFFITPILYVPKMLGPRAALLNWNPFTHFVGVVRDPIMTGEVPILAWQVVGTITIVGWIAAFIVYQKQGRHIPFRV